MGVCLYNPATGRFLQMDPVRGGSANAYEYGFADPVSKYDTDGRWVPLVIGAARLGMACFRYCGKIYRGAHDGVPGRRVRRQVRMYTYTRTSWGHRYSRPSMHSAHHLRNVTRVRPMPENPALPVQGLVSQ